MFQTEKSIKIKIEVDTCPRLNFKTEQKLLLQHDIPKHASFQQTNLAERCKQFNNEEIAPELFKEKLKERLSTADIKQVKEDVLPFVRNPKELYIWSNDYFVQLADMVRIEKVTYNH